VLAIGIEPIPFLFFEEKILKLSCLPISPNKLILKLFKVLIESGQIEIAAENIFEIFY
jgi:hypothetical protein